MQWKSGQNKELRRISGPKIRPKRVRPKHVRPSVGRNPHRVEEGVKEADWACAVQAVQAQARTTLKHYRLPYKDMEEMAVANHIEYCIMRSLG